MIRNIVFDLGGVVIRFDRTLFLQRLGVSPEDEQLLTEEVFLSLEWAMLDRGSLTEADAVTRICQRVPERLHDAVNQLVNNWDQPILPMDGMYELIEELKASGYAIYLLSNASARLHDYWQRVPANRFFDGILVSSDVFIVKPQPEIFGLLCARFGLNANECYFVDDSWINVEGACYSGMNGFVFRGRVAPLRKALAAAGVAVAIPKE